MTLRFVLSKLLQIVLRLWAVETTMPMARSTARPDVFTHAAAQQIYMRSRIEGPVPPRRYMDRE